MTNDEWTKHILDHRIAISDTVTFTDSEAPNSCFAPDRGIVYTVYTASRKNYGESGDIVALAITPLTQPWRSETKIIAERGVTPGFEDSIKITNSTCYYYQTAETLYTAKTHFGQMGEVKRGYVRALFCSSGWDYFYVDYDIQNSCLGPIKHLKCNWNGTVQDMTAGIYKQYLETHGLTGYDVESETPDRLIMSDKFRLQPDGYRYAMATAIFAQPVVVRIKDGTDIVEFVGHIDQCAQYEAQSAVVNGKMYAILRGSKGDNFFMSDDMGKSFHTCGRIEFNTTRPQLLPYKDKVLIAVSLCGITPNRVRDGRNNILLLGGEGGDLSKYRQVFHIADALGFVYYDIFDYKGTLYMIWSNAELYVDKNPQAKDLLWFVRIGEIETE